MDKPPLLEQVRRAIRVPYFRELHQSIESGLIEFQKGKTQDSIPFFY